MRALLAVMLALFTSQTASASNVLADLCDRDDITFFGVEGGDEVFSTIKVGNSFHGTTVAKAYDESASGPTWLIGGNCPLDPQQVQGLFVSEDAANAAASELFFELASGEPKAYANGYEVLLELGAVRATLIFDTMNCVCDKRKGPKE